MNIFGYRAGKNNIFSHCLCASVIILILFSSSISVNAESTDENYDPKLQHIEVRAMVTRAEKTLTKIKSPSLLLRRLVGMARENFNEGRLDDARAFAERAIASLDSLVSAQRDQTPVATPIIEALLQAITRLESAKASGLKGAHLATAEELIRTAEEYLNLGKVSEANMLSKRAIAMISEVEIPKAKKPSPKPKTINLNTASRTELGLIPGMTKRRIDNIYWFRNYIGNFRSVNELIYVPGFSSQFVAMYKNILSI